MDVIAAHHERMHTLGCKLSSAPSWWFLDRSNPHGRVNPELLRRAITATEEYCRLRSAQNRSSGFVDSDFVGVYNGGLCNRR